MIAARDEVYDGGSFLEDIFKKRHVNARCESAKIVFHDVFAKEVCIDLESLDNEGVLMD